MLEIQTQICNIFNSKKAEAVDNLDWVHDVRKGREVNSLQPQISFCLSKPSHLWASVGLGTESRYNKPCCFSTNTTYLQLRERTVSLVKAAQKEKS